MHGKPMSVHDPLTSKRFRKTRILLFLLASVSLPGCDYIERKGQSLIEKGTAHAVEDCITNNSSQMVNEEITRTLCIRENEQPFRAEYNCYKYGSDEFRRAPPSGEFSCFGGFIPRNGKLVLDGSVHNGSANLVLTRYSVEIISDLERLATDPIEYREKWIQLNESEEFLFSFDGARIATPADLDRLNSMDWRVRLHALYVVRIEID